MGDEYESLEDDPEAIPNDVIVYRRVSWEKLGGRDACPRGDTAKLSGNAFTDYPAEKALEMGFPGPCMSVDVSTVLSARGLTPDHVLRDLSGFGLAGVRAGDLRDLRRKNGDPCPQGIMPAPTPAEPWHAVVFGAGLMKKRSGGENRAIADVAFWVLPLVNE